MKTPLGLRFAVLAPLVLLGAIPSFVSAEGWTRFRGPNGSGIGAAAEMPIAWTEKDYRWKIELPGGGFSSPIVDGDRLFITSSLDDGTQIVTALRTDDGKKVWEQRFKADAYKKHRLMNYATSTPTLDEARVYVTWGGPKSTKVVALDRKDGATVWERELGPFVAMHGFGASPMVFEDLLIVMNDQDTQRDLLAMESATGKTVWQHKEKIDTEEIENGATYATPCLFQPERGSPQLIVGRSEAGVQSLDPRSGKTNWLLDVFKYRAVGSPVLAGDRIVAICGSGGGGQRTVVIRPGVPEQEREPEILLDMKRRQPYVPTPLVQDDLLYLWTDSGTVSCIDLNGGDELWQERIGGKYMSSPVLAAGRLYNVSTEGKVVILATGREYKLLGRVELGEATDATPAVADGVMYLRTLSHVMAIEGK